MEIVVNICCVLLGAAGSYVVMQMQEKGRRMMQMNAELTDEVLQIENLMIRDFAAGEISHELTAKIRRTGLRLEIYCNSRRFHFRKNRKLRSAWDDFVQQFAMAKPLKPYRGYEFVRISTPADFGLNIKIDALLKTLI